MSRTIEAIRRHMAMPPNQISDHANGRDRLETDIVVKRRHYIWSESRFVRAMQRFHSNVRVGYNGHEVDGKSVLDLMTLAAPEGTTVHLRIEGPDAAKAMRAVNQFVRSDFNDDR